MKGKVYLILIFSLIILIVNFSLNIYWDSAVYLGMGKYIFSLGKMGLWESSRPLVWPLILGLFGSSIFIGKIIGIILSLGIVYLTYLIGKKVFDEKVGLLASLLVALTPVFINIDKLLSGIPSTFFALLAIYLIFENKIFYSGLFAGLAFMTRFLQIFVFIFLFVFVIYNFKGRIKKLFHLSLGFSIPVLIYLIINTILYKNPLHPFFMQVHLTKFTGWMWFEPWYFYFVEFAKQNYLLLFAVIGIVLIIISKDKNKTGILGICLLFALFYQFISHKEVRFIITFLPLRALIASYGIFWILNKIKPKIVSKIVLAVLLILLVFQVYPQIEKVYQEDYQIIQGYAEYKLEDLWITNPLFLINSQNKANLIYYPTLDSERIDELMNLDAKNIFWNSCDVPCPPWDYLCEEKKSELLMHWREKYTVKYEKENPCEEYIFIEK